MIFLQISKTSPNNKATKRKPNKIDPLNKRPKFNKLNNLLSRNFPNSIQILHSPTRNIPQNQVMWTTKIRDKRFNSIHIELIAIKSMNKYE
jgi:hypothetical protein